MLRGDSPAGDLPAADFNGPNLSSPDVLTDLMLKPLSRSWLVHAEPRDASTSTVPPTLLDINLSSDGHRSKPDDFPSFKFPGVTEAIQFIQAVVNPYSLKFSLPGGALWGQAKTTAGSVVFGNADGSRTSLTGEDWIGRTIRIFVGPKDGALIEFALVADMLSREISSNESSFTVDIDDHSFIFEDALQVNTYAGTGGLEGGTELQGEIKRIPLGVVRQIKPTLVDAANRIYQINDGSFKSVASVEDRGVSLVFDADVADITTATPAAGEFATSLSTGYIKLGSDPDGIVTCSKVEGHNGSSFGYVETVSELIKALAVIFADLSESGEIDSPAFVALESHTAIMGDYVTDKKRTVSDEMDIFHQSAASFGWLKPGKILTVGRITDPDSATADFSLDADKDELRLTPWKEETWETPVYKVFVGYRRYFTTLSETDLDASIPLDERLDLGKKYRFVEAEDAAVKVQTPRAVEITILTNLDLESDAQALADEQLSLRKVIRRQGTFAPRAGLILRGIGDVMEITDDRIADSPKKWVLVGVDNKAETAGQAEQIVFRCFG